MVSRCGMGISGYRIPCPTCIDLPHESLRVGFERCSISHRLLGPFLVELAWNLGAHEVSPNESKAFWCRSGLQ
jgi:hypothetical protein